MKKIAILTFSRALNYGAVLQAYALKTAFQNMGVAAHVIDYRCPKIEKDYKSFVLKYHAGWRVFLKSGIKAACFPFFWYCKFKFSKFWRKYLWDTPPMAADSIYQLNTQYDSFIVGSDQVFNPFGTGRDKNYFLDFVQDKTKRFSYAASFGGVKFGAEDEKFLKEALRNFSCISVREKQGADLAQKLTGMTTYVHLDPTLLLEQKQWEEISQIPPQKDFVLLYLMDRNSKIVQYAENLAKEKRLDLIFLSPVLNLPPNRVKGQHIVPTPPQWLGYFLKAKYVVTNSFHGLAFSINFNKKFFVDFLPPQRGVNSRLENLLDLTGLRSRLIDNIGTDYEAEIDWPAVNAKVAEEREKSLQYLRGIVQ